MLLEFDLSLYCAQETSTEQTSGATQEKMLVTEEVIEVEDSLPHPPIVEEPSRDAGQREWTLRRLNIKSSRRWWCVYPRNLRLKSQFSTGSYSRSSGTRKAP
jgi:hypothetical protein